MEITENRIWAKVRAFKQTIAARSWLACSAAAHHRLAGFLLWEVA